MTNEDFYRKLFYSLLFFIFLSVCTFGQRIDPVEYFHYRNMLERGDTVKIENPRTRLSLLMALLFTLPMQGQVMMLDGSFSVVGDTIPTSAPSNFVMTATSTSTIVATWIDPTESDLDSIRVYKSTDGETFDWIASVAKGDQTYTYTDLSVLTEYYGKITAIDDSSNLSSDSEIDSATTFDDEITGLPVAPTNLIVTDSAGVGGIGLEFTPNPESNALGYIISVDDIDYDTVVSPSATSYYFSTPYFGWQREFKVKAYNGEGQSAYTDSVISQRLPAINRGYFVSTTGNASNTGKHPTQSWTWDKMVTTIFTAGDTVLWKADDVFSAKQWSINFSGTEANPILISAYGGTGYGIADGNNTVAFVLQVNAENEWIDFERIELRDNNATLTSHWGAALLKLNQRCQNISITNCRFNDLGGTFVIDQRRGGMLMMIDPAYITVTNSDFTGKQYSIFCVTNYNNSHNDGHHLTFTNNYFHRLGEVSTNLFSGNARGIAVNFMQWFSANNGQMLVNINGSSPNEGTAGTVFGSEGTFRDILLDGNRVDSAGLGFNWYRDPDFIHASRKGYNWVVSNNDFNLIEAEAIGLTEIGFRNGQADTAIIVSGNTIDSVGMKWINNLWGLNHGVNAIQTHAWDNAIIENNTISNFGTAKTGDGHGIIADISIESGNLIPPNIVVEKNCDSIIVRNNTIYNGLVNFNGEPAGVVAYGTSSGINVYAVTNSEFYNNIIYDCQVGIYGPTSSRNDNNKIINNTIHSSSFSSVICTVKTGTNTSRVDTIRGHGSGIRASGQSGVIVKNNAITNGAIGLHQGGEDDGSDYDYNLTFNNFQYNSQVWTTGANDIVADPVFTDTTAYDFTPDTDSPLIDASTEVTLMYDGHLLDFFGNPIVGTKDRGAIEKQ